MTEHILYGGDVKLLFDEKYMPEPNSGCWLWTGAVCRPPRMPYGKCKHAGVQTGAHRAAWMIYRGPIPPGLHVLHKCDNPYCVNPAHLWLGTEADNARDRDAKGRRWNNRGERHPLARISADIARSIYNDTRSQKKIAKAFGVSSSSVQAIKERRIWRHIHGDI